MELLIIKSGPDYIRIKDGTFIRTGLDKASVFPMDRLCLVKEHAENMKHRGFDKISIKKLILTEEGL